MKNIIARLMVILAMPVAFNLIFFIFLDRDSIPCAWGCYVFFHLAFLGLFLPLLFKSSPKLAVNTTTLWAISIIYFVVEVLTCSIALYANPDHTTMASIIQMLELVLFLMTFFSSVLANNKTETTTVELKADANFLNDCRSTLNMLCATVDDKILHEHLSVLLADFKASPISKPGVASDLEDEIRQLLESLSANPSEEGISKACRLLRARNIALKSNIND
jgi:hypothetical protein